jgi:uncharacterized protein YcfJ
MNLDSVYRKVIPAIAAIGMSMGVMTATVQDAAALDLGGALGAAVGAALGNRVGNGNGKMIATAAGATIGGQMGSGSSSQTQQAQYQAPQQQYQPQYQAPQYNSPNPSSERGMSGALIGGVGGALLGRTVGNGNGKTAATAVGGIVGAIVGDRMQNGSGSVASNSNVNNDSVRMGQVQGNGIIIDSYTVAGNTYQVASGHIQMSPDDAAGFQNQANRIVSNYINYNNARHAALVNGTGNMPNDWEVKNAERQFFNNLNEMGKDGYETRSTMQYFKSVMANPQSMVANNNISSYGR